MHISVLVEPAATNGYRAQTGEPLGLFAEGNTPEEALQLLRRLLAARMAAGSQLVSLEVHAAENPWLQVAGMFKDDPLFDEWQQAIAERRREVDADPEIP